MEATKLNTKQQKFVEAYLRTGNATESAIAAGYSKKTAYSAGPRLLKNVDIQKAVTKPIERALEKAELSKERLIQELCRIAFFDVRKLFNDIGGMKKPEELDDDTAAAIAGIDIDELYEFSDGEKEQVGFTKKVRMVSKLGALQELMAHMGLNKAAPANNDKVFNLTINLGEPTEKKPGDNAKVIDQLPVVRL